MVKVLKKNQSKAIELYEKAVKLNNTTAMFNLGICYQNGEGVVKNFPKAFDLFKSASNIGDFDSTFQCYLFLSRGIGIERNLGDSLKFLQVAVDNDYAKGYVEYGLWLLFTQNDEQGAVSYFQKSSLEYLKRGKFWFGYCLLQGIGIQKSFYRGLELIRQSYEQNCFLSNFYLSVIQPTRTFK